MTPAQGPSPEPLPGKELISPEDLRRIIVDGDAEILVNSAERLGRRLQEGNVARQQMLGIYGDIWRIDMAWATSQAEAQRGLRMMKPKLASLAKRAKETGEGRETFAAEELAAVMCQAVDVVLEQADEGEQQATSRQQAFERFMSFFEATIAYHRYHGG